MNFELDFEQYVPVQHQITQAYFAFRASDNKDFDGADDSETYLCYPLQKNGSLNARINYFLSKQELQTIHILL